MVYGKILLNGLFGGTPILGNHHLVLSQLFNLGSKVRFVDFAERWGWRFCKKFLQKSPGWLHWVHQTKKNLELERQFPESRRKCFFILPLESIVILCSCFHGLSTFDCLPPTSHWSVAVFLQVVLYFASHTIVSKLQARQGLGWSCQRER